VADSIVGKYAALTSRIANEQLHKVHVTNMASARTTGW